MARTPSSDLPRAVRWSLRLGAGAVIGVAVGFTVGLTKPRAKR